MRTSASLQAEGASSLYFFETSGDESEKFHGPLLAQALYPALVKCCCSRLLHLRIRSVAAAENT